jgi:hypothetical protein
VKKDKKEMKQKKGDRKKIKKSQRKRNSEGRGNIEGGVRIK